MEDQTKKKVPEIRFKGFSGEWKEKTLEEITFKIGSGKTPKGGNSIYVQTGVPLLRSQNITNDQVSFEDVAYITPDIDEEMKNSRVVQGDVLLNITGASIGRSAVFRKNVRANVNQHVCIIRTIKGFNSDFTQLNLTSNRGQKNIESSQAGGGREGLNFQQIGRMSFKFPSQEDEQAVIGSYFSVLDRIICLHQQKHEKLVTLKKAMLKKMFPQNGATTPEIRFKGFSEPWVERALVDDVTFFSGLTYSPSNVVGYGGTLVLRSSNVKNGKIVDADNVYVDSNVINCENVQLGDIIVVVRNGSRSLIGKHAQIKSSMSDTVIGAFMTGIRSEQPMFINALLDTPQFGKEVEKNMGATINQITAGTFNMMRFRFPSLKEQQKIGSYFHQLDKLIAQHGTQLTKLKQIKTACLEKMFV